MSDLKAACERLRRVAAGALPIGVYADSGGWRDQDYRTLANAYLAEHCADDEIETTSEWLRENVPQAKIVDDGQCDVEFVVVCSKGSLTMGTVVSFYTPTRGHVRRLMAVIGLEAAKEGV